MSQVTVSGAVSGLDTASIINQLVSVQTNQQTLLKTQQAKVQSTADAFSSLITSVKSLAGLAKDLAKTSAWVGATASSSSTSVSATATSTTSAAITLDVTSVAAAHTLISADSVSATNSVVATGPLTLTTSDGTATSIDVGSGSLSDVVSAINSSSTGLRAAAVQTGAGQYRLQVASATTGATSAFTLDGVTGFSGMNVLTQGSDATVHIGTDPATAYDATSATNTFTSLVPGLSFTVSKVESGVTLSSTIDGSAVADKVSKLVDAANALLSDIAAKTAYNTTTKTGGPLTGQSSARALQQNILSTVSTSGAAGVQLTRDGQLTFDRSAFLKAFKADPAKVADAFGAKVAFTPSAGASSSTAKLSAATDTARAGTYDLIVSTAPQRETWSLAPAADLTGQVFALTRDDTTISYTATSTDTLADVANALNERSVQNSFGVTTSVDSGSLTLTADNTGNASAFSASVDGVDGAQLQPGLDLEGAIDGQAATGVGSVLSLASGTGGAVGLGLLISTSSTDVNATGGNLGSITYTPGLAQRLVLLAGDASATTTGVLSAAQDGAKSQVTNLQKQVDAWNDRLTAYRETLTRQFTAMETTMAQLKSSMSALSGLSTSLISSGTSG